MNQEGSPLPDPKAPKRDLRIFDWLTASEIEELRRKKREVGEYAAHVFREESRAAARELAEAVVRERHLGDSISDVKGWDELKRPPAIYIAGPEVLRERCWFAYVERPSHGRLESNLIIVFDRDSKEIVYVGSANDGG